MKRILLLILATLLLFSGCTLSEKEEKNNDKLTITATIFPQYDFLRSITEGADVELNLLVPPGKEIHGFETALSDVSAVSNCDLFVYVGSQDDAWVKDVPESGNKRLALCEIVTDYKDEHVWTSPKNAIVIVQKLCDSLCEIDS